MIWLLSRTSWDKLRVHACAPTLVALNIRGHLQESDTVFREKPWCKGTVAASHYDTHVEGQKSKWICVIFLSISHVYSRPNLKPTWLPATFLPKTWNRLRSHTLTTRTLSSSCASSASFFSLAFYFWYAIDLNCRNSPFCIPNVVQRESAQKILFAGSVDRVS